MTKEELKQYIDENVYENQDGEITGESLNAVLKAIVDDGGTEVEANPTGEATTTLNKIKIGETNYNIPQTDTSNLATKQELQQGLSGKQDTIADLQQIRTRADEGHTALQPRSTGQYTENNFVSFDANGGIKDSGCNEGSFIKGVKQNGTPIQPVDGVVDVTVQDGKSALQIYNETYGTNLDEAQFIDVLKQNYPMEYVAYDATAAAQTIGTGFASIGMLAADSTTAGKLYLMPNDGTTPTGTILFVTVQTGVSTYAWYKLGDLNVPSNVLTDNRIVNDLITGGVKGALSAEQGKLIAETTMEVVEGSNILNPDDIIVGVRIDYYGMERSISGNPDFSNKLYGCTKFINIDDLGLLLNCGVGHVSSVYSGIMYDENQDPIMNGTYALSVDVINDGSPVIVDTSRTGFENVKYVRFNLPLESVLPSGEYFAIYRQKTTPVPQYVPYTPPTFAQKIPSNVITKEDIVDNLEENSSEKPLSSKQGTYLAEITTYLKEGENILDPSTIKVGRRIKNDGTVQLISGSSFTPYLYGCTDFIELTDKGLTLNYSVMAHSSINGIVCYDENQDVIQDLFKNAASDGSSVTITQTGSYANVKYVRFNLPLQSFVPAGENYAIYRAETLPSAYIPYTPPTREIKPQQFSSGEFIDNVPIDNTQLSNPSDISIAKAIDIRRILGNINYSKNTLKAIYSGEGRNSYFRYYVARGVVTYDSTSKSSVFVLPLEDINKITFLAGEKATNGSGVGYAFGTFQNGYDGTSVDGFVASSYGVYKESQETVQVPYEVDVPKDNSTHAVITLWHNAGVDSPNFYCIVESGATVEDLIKNIENIEPKQYCYSSSGNIRTCIIQCAKEHNYLDGTMPTIEWYLLEDNEHNFYYSKDLNSKVFLFNFQNSNTYQFGILANGDIIAVKQAVYLPSNTEVNPQSDGKRVNPYIFKANEQWAIAHEVDFGEYDSSTEEGLKPCGWLANKGFRLLPNGDAIFGEYTRPTVETANVWKISGDASNPSNWEVVKKFGSHENPIIGDYSPGQGNRNYKHIHCIAYDFYSGVIYCTTGDVDAYAQIWYSTDNGANWTQIEKNASLNNGQQYRLCMMTFTPDYILWGTDTPGTGSSIKHVVYRGERGVNGVLDQTTLTMLCDVYSSDFGGNFSTYGQAYIEEYNALFLFDRQDNGGNQATVMPLYIVDIETGDKILVGELRYYSSTATTMQVGFRCKFKEWYPINGAIHVGFGYDDYTRNKSNKCDNTPTVNVGNYVIYIAKDGEKWSCRFKTIYV